jgi:DNA-binding XRE family transcriptional regulator
MKARRRADPVELVEVPDAPRLPDGDEGLGGDGDAAEQVAWRDRMRRFGRLVRHARETIGWSQQQLGEQADVSQGAVSRLEAGHGLATPLVIVQRLHLALVAQLRTLDPTMLDDALRVALARDLLGPLTQAMPMGSDATVERLVLAYHGTPGRSRERLLAVARVAAASLRTEE